jgi:hypothetical protein
MHGGRNDAPNPAEGFAVETFPAEAFAEIEVFGQVEIFA